MSKLLVKIAGKIMYDRAVGSKFIMVRLNGICGNYMCKIFEAMPKKLICISVLYA